MKSIWKQWIYLTLAVVGLLSGYYAIGLSIQQATGQSDGVLDVLAVSAVANPLAAFFLLAYLVAFVCFLLWYPADAQKLDMKRWWIYLVLVLFTPFIFVFSLYFAMRERRLIQLAVQK